MEGQRKYPESEIRVVSISDNNYPAILKEIYNPPKIIYVKGKLPRNDEITLAVVGSRKPTDYGIEATEKITSDLTKAGVVIISGLAYGIDKIAHQAALALKGKTIAVLAHGLDMIYPAAHYQLAEEILRRGGALISEYPPGIKPTRQAFPARNRIVSGLSRGIIITEAGEFSGTLHTASFALEQNRQVYAVPGRIDSDLSTGPNELLSRGAVLTRSANDILEDLGLDGYSVKT